MVAASRSSGSEPKAARSAPRKSTATAGAGVAAAVAAAVRARARLGVVEEAAALLGIPAVLDGVLGPARESARDLIPAITEDRLERHEQEVFGRRPGRLHQMRVQVVLPAPVQK